MIQDFEDVLISNEKITILDVREPGEIENEPFKSAGNNEIVYIPIEQIPERTKEITMDYKIYVLCRSGVRSRYVGEFLEENGFPETYNVEGGLIAWEDEVLGK